ncbi:hypothetical protein ACF0H5_013219 [Mactra antiquata]
MANTRISGSIGAPSSQYKIQCNASTILIGDREFLSATDALEVYLSQYDGFKVFTKLSSPYKRSANDLLNPKSMLHMTAERSLETGVRATETEMKLADQRDSINESLLNMKKSVTLKAEVEEALNKSQDLIKQINLDDFPSKSNVPIEVGSLATDVLVSIDPTTGYRETGSGEDGIAPSWKSKHVYGYKRPRNRRSKTLSSVQIAHDMMALTSEQPQQSFTAQPNDRAVKFQDENEDVLNTSKQEPGKYTDDISILLAESPNTSRLSRSPNKNLRERSRSISPSILKRERKMFESGLREKPIPDYYTDFNISAPKAPSWVDTMNTSDVSDSDWKRRDFTVSKPPPSWVNDIGDSDITSVVVSPSKPSKKLEFQDLLRPLPVINTQNTSNTSDPNDTLPPPGLTYKDLVGDTSKLQSSTNTQQKERLGSPTLSEKLNILKCKTTATLKRYHDRIKPDINLDSPAKDSILYNNGDNVPRCSSLDTEALIAGIVPPGQSDITGASPITPGDCESIVTVAGSPGKSKRPKSPDTDIVLNGDRPWEVTASYKAPVSVDKRSKSAPDEQNYSGGSQPGSLEALKNMIFKLQQEAVHTDSEDEGSRTKISERVYKLRAEAANLGIQVSNDKLDKLPAGNGGNKGDIPSLQGYDFNGEPGGQNLEKALVHLDRLKNLVNSQQPKGDNQGATGVTPLCAHMENS